ncbi:ubiquitin 12 [Euphorbia peplus]|nr:ubiquitin 12 [Euphorbia peplus]
MQVHVESKTTTLEVESNDTIDNLTNKLRAIWDIPAYGYRLIFDGAHLDGKRTLAFYNILNQSTIALLIFLRR